MSIISIERTEEIDHQSLYFAKRSFILHIKTQTFFKFKLRNSPSLDIHIHLYHAHLSHSFKITIMICQQVEKLQSKNEKKNISQCMPGYDCMVNSHSQISQVFLDTDP